ncbi:MAG: oligopeptide transporter, OPT family [Gemmataceae bacterium]
MASDPKSSFQPFVPADQSPPEFTFSAVVTGTCLGLIFAASSLYLVLKVGMTVSASIPVAVLAITLFRGVSSAFGLRRATILENNIVQTAGSAGESIAFGVGVTMPALLLLGYGMDLGRVMTVSILGGLLGILAMIPLRRAFIVQMHGRPGQPGTLLYPEGTACAQVLISGERGGTTGKTVFAGFGLAFLHKFLTEGMNLFVTPAKATVGFINKAAAVSVDMASELLGVGFIIGVRTSSVMMAGAVLGYLVIIPIIYFVGEHAAAVVPPADKPIKDMSIREIRNNYLLYIGAGTVATAGIISMFKTMPIIVRGLLAGLRGGRGGDGAGGGKRTDRDMPMPLVLGGGAALIGLLTVFLAADVGWVPAILGALLVVAFGFLFVTVSARLTGEIGSSSNPISGMTTATLMVTCLIFLALGWTTSSDRVMALSVAAVVCIACSNGGTVAQSLKTGFLVGGTPAYMQYAISVGALVSGLVIGATLIYGLNRPETVFSAKPEHLPAITLTQPEVGRLTQTETHDGKTYKVFDPRNDELTADHPGYTPRPEVKAVKPGRYLIDPASGKPELLRDDAIMGKLEQRDDGSPVKRQFEAPKTQVLGIVINGVLKRDLNWTMIGIGAMIAVMLELCGVSALAFAVGVYVPMSVSAPIFIGGLVRWAVDRRFATQAAAEIAAAGDDPEAKARAEVEAIRKSETSPGVLLASGYIAGGSLAGVMLAFFAFSDTLPRDLTAYQYAERSVGAELPLPEAARKVAADRLGDGFTSEQLDAVTKEVIGQNDEVPYLWVRVPAGTVLKLPENKTHTTPADTTLGRAAAEALGREWKAKQIYDLNKDKLKLPDKLPAEAKLTLPQPEWPTLVAVGALVLILLLVGTERLLKSRTD